jgi:UDP-N-acetylmuramoyl-tripeptide--D-alanyl-D-alanine ligase
MMSLEQARAGLQAGGLAARVRGDAATRFESVSTDTRTLGREALYVALRGPRFDGHDFAGAAAAAGAAALLAEHELPSELPQLLVADTRAALGGLAAHWRARLSLPLIAVAGSNGKTTTTQMIAAILAQAFGERDGKARWFATRGNRNNEIGVPLMLLELRAEHRAAVLELGMNHAGEIATLAGWARPGIAVITNAQREHQEFLESVEATARENGAAIGALAPEGVAVFPADDACAAIWRALAGERRVLDFALDGPAAVRGQVALGTQSCRLDVQTPAGALQATIALGGEHNARNALAAAAASLAAGIGLPAIAAGLEAFRPVAGRGTRRALAGGASLIDDSYNANPDSVRAAIDLLARQPAPRVLIFGDMGEVGTQGPAFHAEIGRHARARGIEHFLALGEQARGAVQAFGAGARHFDSAEALAAAAHALAAAPGPAPTFLAKGSRFMRLERVVALLDAGGGTGGHA